MADEPRPIQLLPEHLIDQIKAGEVIERPASLVKELLENALDAGADRIKIHLIENGLELIQIEDNGHGMSFDQLPLAFCRHATSKIERFEHLYDLHSYGFRGEALASMASVARITCVSTPEDNPQAGGRLVIHGAQTLSHSEHQNTQHGTSFYIKDLFYNTPARLKFIKSKNAEKNGLKRILNAFFLCAPETEFTLRWDEGDKQLFKATPKESISNRVSQVLLKSSRPKADQLYYFDECYEDHRILGFFSHEASKGHAHKRQYLFANNRLFFDRGLHQTIIRGMEKLWGPGLSGHYCVFITAPPGALDVNVHPHKTQIKFFKSSLIFSLLSGALKSMVDKKSSTHFEKQELPQTEPSHGTFDVYEAYKDSPYQNESQTSQWIQRDLDSHAQSSLIFLSQYFALYRPAQEKNYLIHIGRIFSDHFTKNILNKAPLAESQLTPLLISEPYKIPVGPVDSVLKQLKDYAFELDRLDDKTLVLRGIPRVLENFNYRLIVGELLNFLNRSHSEDLPKKLGHFFEKELLKWPQSFPHDQEAIAEIIGRLCQSPDTKAGIKMIDDKALNTLFDAHD